MKPNFPKNPYIGQIYYCPTLKKVYRYDEPVDKDNKLIEQLCQWEDITDCFLTLNYTKIRGEEKWQQKGENK